MPGLLSLACLLVPLAVAQPATPATDVAFERDLNAVPTPRNLRAWHDLFGSAPHIAGTPGDALVLDSLTDAFERMGLQVDRHEFLALLPMPVDGIVEIVSPIEVGLTVIERTLAEDPDTAHPDLTIGWNAYSGNGDATAAVVYANYGTLEDFETLRELGVDVDGRIVIARYGRNFRGYKAKFAEAAGAVGLVIYTDPDDSGYRKGLPYPEGGWADETSIQRGSIVTLDWPGDPLTPFVAADENATRADPDDLDLPRIPVQPVGWGAASEILSRMTGPAVPDGWQGGLPFVYRTTGGPDLRVRVAVTQDRSLRRSANILAMLPGSTTPEQKVIIGCHHDAWGFGAGDPLAGTIVLLECARSFATLASDGRVPDRTIVFAAWGAEEYGMVGSVEWCETHRDDLLANAVAYINLDAAAMGTNLGVAASPQLKRLIEAASRSVPQARGTPGETVYEAWLGDRDRVPFGDLGGGSDHVGFYCHLGIPSCGLSAHGGKGVSYHSNYDTLAWYRQVVGDDYEPALMLTRLANLITARLADAPLLPLELGRFAPDIRVHLETLRTRAETLDFDADLAALQQAVDTFEAVAGPVQERLDEAFAAGRLDAATLRQINRALMSDRRFWLHEQGLPQRPWFRNVFAATDPNSGYAAWMLPGMRYYIEARDAAGLKEAQRRCITALEATGQLMESIDAKLGR